MKLRIVDSKSKRLPLLIRDHSKESEKTANMLKRLEISFAEIFSDLGDFERLPYLSESDTNSAYGWTGYFQIKGYCDIVLRSRMARLPPNSAEKEKWKYYLKKLNTQIYL